MPPVLKPLSSNHPLRSTILLPPRMDPLWNSLVVGGFYGGKPFLGTVGMIGTNYTDDHVATGASGRQEIRVHWKLDCCRMHLGSSSSGSGSGGSKRMVRGLSCP